MISHRSPAGRALALTFAAALCAVAATDAAQPAAAGGEGKIPITASSEQARATYFEARDLAERLRGQEARSIYEKAVGADPDFALAWLGLANTQPSAKEFFAKLDKAVALADKVSPGERLMILGAQAGASGDAATQVERYQELVDKFPQDERALVLLGNSHFGAQRYPEAIALYERAAKIAPGFSQIYNQLGYSYRFLGRLDDAQRAFMKYTEVLPEDPNPYDSLAELLLKRGQFDKSIASYRKALGVRSDFVNSNFGIATCLDLQGKGAEARAEIDAMLARAADDGQRRAGLFAKTVSYAYEGNFPAAQAEMQKQLAIAEKSQDALGMAGDLAAMGNLALAAGDPAAAERHYRRAFDTVTAAPSVAEANKANQRRFAIYNRARVALAKGELATAKQESEAFTAAVAGSGNPFQLRQTHEIAGRIALAEKKWEMAIGELEQANQLDPSNRFRLSLAYAGKGDAAKAKELATGARDDNTLTNLNLAFVRLGKITG